MKKEKSALEKRTRKAYRFIFALLLLIMAISIIGLLIIDHKITTLGTSTTLEFWHDLFGNILGAAVGAAVIDVIMDYTSKDEKEESIQKSIITALCPTEPGPEPPMIAKLFSKREFEGFLKNGMAAYGGNNDLGAGCFDFFRENCNQMRRHESYKVDISPDWIHQSFRHTAVFERPKIGDPEIRIFFIFANTEVSGGELDRYLSDPTYTFREEFDCPEFEKEVTALAASLEKAKKADRKQKTEELCEKMKLSLTLYKTEREDQKRGLTVAPEDIQFTLCRTAKGEAFGLNIVVPVPAAYVFEEASGPSEYHAGNGYIHFISQVDVTYPAKRGHNLFPIVYSRIAVSPSFRVTFKEFKDPDIKCFPFLSFNTAAAESSEDGNVTESNHTYSFTTTRTVFPRSGVVFSWINPDNV